MDAYSGGPGRWLRAVAEAVDAPSGGDVKADPDLWLERAPDDGVVLRSRRDDWGKGIDPAYFQGCADRLFSDEELARDARRWLLRERGIKLRQSRAWGLGWNGVGITFPFWLGGLLVAGKIRPPSKGHKTLPGWTGCKEWPLFAVGRDKRLVLCEGELDALRCRSVGVPACSMPLGAGTWKAWWSKQLAGRRVEVVFDVGAEAQARAAVEHLHEAKVWARHVPLPSRVTGYDLTDYLRDHSRAQLERLIGWRS